MKKILIIDPDSQLQDIYQQFFTQSDYKVFVFNSAKQALNDIDQKKPNLIIIEPLTIDHGGFELLYEIRSYPEWQTIPIIIHSFINPGTIKLMQPALKQLGIEQYFYKPESSLSQIKSAGLKLMAT